MHYLAGTKEHYSKTKEEQNAYEKKNNIGITLRCANR